LATNDLIILNNLGFYGYHGAIAEENRLGQRFWIDLTIGTDLTAPALTDDLEQAISYADIYDVVAAAFAERKFNLIEALAQHIINQLFVRFEPIEWVRLRVRKPEAPIPMVAGEAAIELYRERPE